MLPCSLHVVRSPTGSDASASASVWAWLPAVMSGGLISASEAITSVRGHHLLPFSFQAAVLEASC